VWVSGIACSVDQVSFGPVAIGVASSGHVFAIESALQGRQGAPLLEYRREPALCQWQGAGKRGTERIFFGREAAWREETGRGGDDQGAVRAGERGAERSTACLSVSQLASYFEKSWIKAV
jgi:hypothetical protein